MAAKKKKPPVSLPRRIFRWIIRTAACLLTALVAWSYIAASVVHLNFATLPLRDLPPSFEGTTILYLSDLHINSLNSVEKVSCLMEELMILQPDLLLLGGDYTNFDPFMRLSATAGGSDAHDVETEMRDLFFLSLAAYQPPLGKYGVAGENDNLLEGRADASLKDAMLLGGVTLLRDEAVRIEKNGETLTLLGVDDWSTGMQDTRTPAQQVTSGECVILICHNPEAIPSLNNQPSADGIWMDAALCGHTHGGTISLFGRELMNPLGNEERYSGGWHLENSAKVLVSRGIGNSLLPLRLNAQPQAHLITLTRY